MQQYRTELVTAIQVALAQWQSEHEDEAMGIAIHALDALGFAAGQIFSMAPDLEARQYGRLQFLAAVEAGLEGQRDIKHLN